jgi:hypothetical protein
MHELLEQLASLAGAAESMAGVTPDTADSAEQTAESYIQRTADALNAYSISLSSLSDVSGVDEATIGQYLTFNGTVWAPSTLSLALGDLSDVASTAPTSGQLLGWNVTNSRWEPETQAAGVAYLGDLSDTAVVSPSSGDGLQWNGSSWAKVSNNTTNGDLSTYLTDSDISDVVTYGDSVSVLNDMQVSSPSSGQLLAYNGTNSRFENTTPSSGATILNDLNDVTVGSPSSGDGVEWNGTSWAKVTNNVTLGDLTTYVTDGDIAAMVETTDSISALSDVGLTSPIAGQFLVWNSTSAEFQDKTVTAGMVQAISNGVSAFTDAFSIATNPPVTSMVAVESLAGSMRYATLSALPISSDVQDALDLLSIGQHTRIFYIENPTASDSFPIGAFPVACTITRITFITDVGTVDFNLEERVEATPFTAGTDVFAADDQASTTNSVVTSFSNASMAANAWLWFAASAVASSPTKLIIKVTYTED